MGRIYAGIGILLVVVILGFWVKSLKAELKASESKITSLKTDLEGERIKLKDLQTDLDYSNKVIRNYQQAGQEIRYVDRIVTQEVIKYKDVIVDRFVFPSEWVYTYNLSTLRLSETNSTTGTNGSSTGSGADQVKIIVDDAEALEIITNNNRICVRELEKLRALQLWALGPQE